VAESDPARDRSQPTVLLSYDVAGAARSLSVRVAQLIFGRSDAGPDAPPPYIARPGVVWIGQSVFLMPGPVAMELAEKLRGLGAAVTTARVTIARTELEAFRRRMQHRSVPASILTDLGQPREVPPR